MRASPAPAALLLLASAAAARAAPAASSVSVPATSAITVTVSGIRSTAGSIHVDVCPQADFLHACPYSISVRAQKGSVTVTLPAVPPGTYAVQAFHDANANGALDQGIFGIPKEGVGFSHDAMAKLQRPKWAAAAFDHGAVTQTIPVTLRYFLG